jgi:maltose O-acetyltransferase
MGSLEKVLKAADEELSMDLRKVGVRAVSQILPQHAFNRVRTMLLRGLGIRISAKSHVAGTLKITGPGSAQKLLSIGPGCYVTGPLHVDLMDAVRIGANVYLGYEVMLITVSHEVGLSAQRCGPSVSGPIDIGNGVWIGSRAIILPGVRVGDGAVVAAGAVVTKDVAPNTLVAGVPARFVRDLDEGDASPIDRGGRATPAVQNGHSPPAATRADALAMIQTPTEA